MSPKTQLRRSFPASRSAFSWPQRILSVVILFVLFCTFLVKSVGAQQQSAPTSGGSASALASRPNFTYVGVNMHSLLKYDDATVDQSLGYLAKCGVNTVRVFAPVENGGVNRISAVSNIAGKHGIKLVVALADFANSSSQMRGANQNPTEYFSGGYNTQGYTGYAREVAASLNGNANIAVVELANEPHCVGKADCLDPFVNWVTEIAAILGGKSYGVSIGTMVNKFGYGDEPGVGFGRSNAAPGITQGSAHFYPEAENDKRQLLIQAAQEAKGLGKEMMMGEIGFKCNSEPCTNSSNDQSRARKIREEMHYFANQGYDGFLYWQFSGFKSSPLANDPFSWFANDANDIDNPICQALRDGPLVLSENAAVSSAAEPPTFIFPRDQIETEKYLANSQVYCANRFELRPEFKGPTPPLTNALVPDGELAAGLPIDQQKIHTGDGIINPYEYPINKVEEVTRIGNASVSGGLSFPLFRDSAGGISIESDLSEINPNETWFEALQRQAKPKAAPQFFLTSPQTQCLNVVHQIEYVRQACETFSKKSLGECGANTLITLPSGTTRRLVDFAPLFPDDAVCNNISDDLAANNERAQALRSISPSTPKLFKMAFVAQHTHLHHDDYFATNFYMLQRIASWFNFGGVNSEPFYGEKFDVVPIWYHAGIAVDQFDEYIDPATGIMRPYAFDPISLTGKDKADDRKAQSNFIGPWTNTYEAVMAPHFQDAIAEKRMRTVYENWQLLQQTKNQWTQTALKLTIDNEVVADGVGAPIECSGVKGSSDGASCLCVKEDNDLCPNGSAEDIVNAFPEDYVVHDPVNFAKQLKFLLISRIKAGVQRSNQFSEGGTNETLSRRVWDKCMPHPENEGVQEAVTSLGSTASQNPRNPVESITNYFRSKLVNDAIPDQDPVMRQNTQTFLILPDEALTIEVAQAYIAPMFLSPEMYSNIITGKTDVLPVDELAASQQRDPFLSAFLRTFGVSRNLSSSTEGYVKVRPTHYSYTPSCAVEGCECKAQNETRTGIGPDQWMTIEDFNDLAKSNSPACDNLQITKFEKVEESSYEVKYQYELKNPNPNPETPGQFAALNEFVRRLAFTPSHMQSTVTYPGLESFYRSQYDKQDFTSSAGTDETGTEIPRACVYAQPRTITPSESGYTDLNSLRPLVCKQAERVGMPAELLRALLEVEGSPLLRAIRNKSSYVCKPNSAGAVGPMGILVTQCSTKPYEFETQANSTTPHDWCTPEGALAGGANIALGKIREVRLNNPGINIDSDAGYLRVADLYLGRGSCGSFDDDTDGRAKPLRGDERDYCAYIRDVTNLFKSQNYCSGQ